MQRLSLNQHQPLHLTCLSTTDVIKALLIMNPTSQTLTNDSLAASWIPIIPSSEVSKAKNIALGFIDGEELAIWRAEDGTAQAWANRCPHRGLRFTLGRIINGRLSCAYHGWEYSANDGRCAAIPAHPQMPPPRNVCATTFKVTETNGMIWASRSEPTSPPPQTNQTMFLRTLAVRAPRDFVAKRLVGQGWTQSDPNVLEGTIDGSNVTAFVSDAGNNLVLLHINVSHETGLAQVKKMHSALRRLRQEVETCWISEGEDK